MKAYPAYKDSGIKWIDEIPEHWEVKPLKYTVKINQDSLPENTHEDYEIQYIDIGNVNQDGLVNHPKVMSFGSSPSRARRVLKKGDTIVSTVRTYLKAIAYINSEDENLIASTGFAVLTPTNQMHAMYLYYLISTQKIIDTISSLSVGVSYPAINSSDLGSISIWFPKVIEEQQTIANYLDRKTHLIDTLIENKQKLISLLKEQRAAIINQAVTKGLNPNVKLKDSGIAWLGEIPEHWELKNFRRICRLQQGLQIAQSERFHETGPNMYEYITVKSFHAGDKYDSREYIENPSKRVICEPDDILLARTGATGEVISGLHGAFHNNFFKVEYDKKKVDKNYLIYYLSNAQIKKYLLLMAGTTTVPDLNHGDFLDAPFVAPNIREQQSIVYYLDTQTTRIDKSMERQERQIDHLKEYRTALISEVVTGKIDVRDSGIQEVRPS